MAITITRIESQKKNKNRYSLYAGDMFLTGISGETLLHYNLHTGATISEQLLDDIKSLETKIALREQAYRFLARRAHSVKEIREKLLKKGFDRNSIDRLLQELKSKNYLNDREFARLLVTDEIQLRRSGPLLLKQKLIQKGIAAVQAEELIAKLYSEEMRIRNCRYLAVKKISSLRKKSPDKQKQQLAAYLQGKGFRWETIQPIINELVQEANHEFD